MNAVKSTEISISFFVAPSRSRHFINAVNSLFKCSTIPIQISAYFNPAVLSADFSEAVDFCRRLDIKQHHFTEFESLAKLWNHSIKESKSEHHIISNDDVLFDNHDSIESILNHHKMGYKLVKAAEAFSCFSISKRLVNTVGFFDENFVWSWEDADYTLRMFKMNIRPFEIHPNTVTHLRVPGDRNDEYWNKSSEYFFDKWDVEQLLLDLGIIKEKFKLNAEQRKNLLLQGFFNDNFYKNLSQHIKLK